MEPARIRIPIQPIPFSTSQRAQIPALCKGLSSLKWVITEVRRPFEPILIELISFLPGFQDPTVQVPRRPDISGHLFPRLSLGHLTQDPAVQTEAGGHSHDPVRSERPQRAHEQQEPVAADRHDHLGDVHPRHAVHLLVHEGQPDVDNT